MNPAIALSFFTKKKTKDLSVDFPQDATRLKVVVNAGDIVSLYSTFIDSAYLDVAKVEWGDGESGMLRDHSTSIGGGLYECSHYEHQYEQAGTYNIDIKGACIVGTSPEHGRDKIVQICSTDSAFEEVTRELCENTTSLEIVDFTPIRLHLIDSDAFRNSAVKVIRCSKVEEINPVTPFDNTPNLTDIYLTEHYASEIESLQDFPFGTDPSVTWHFKEAAQERGTYLQVADTETSIEIKHCAVLDSTAEATVDWGDGTVEDLKTLLLTAGEDDGRALKYGAIEHQYAQSGGYTITLKGVYQFSMTQTTVGPHGSATVIAEAMKITKFGSNDDALTKIPSRAFYGATEMTRADFSDSGVVEVGADAFFYTGLTLIKIAPSANISYDGVFGYSQALTDVFYARQKNEVIELEGFPFDTVNGCVWHFADEEYTVGS